ncbi:MAG: hypothetical protein MJA29_00530 [Candidatus Omnitrophica bacterium]|nr:hypothetical protein [Candidatus Omnitrophota bacterium]
MEKRDYFSPYMVPDMAMYTCQNLGKPFEKLDFHFLAAYPMRRGALNTHYGEVYRG